MPKVTPELLIAALDGFAAQKQRIDEKIAELRAQLTGTARDSNTPTRGRRRRKMSASARAHIAAAQRARWARTRGTTTTAAPPKKKRKLSAAGRRAIIAATKKRWEAHHKNR